MFFSIGFGTRHLSDIPELLDGRVLSVVEDYFGVVVFLLPQSIFRGGLRAAVNEVSVELKKSARLHEETQRGSHSNSLLAYTHLSDYINLFFLICLFFAGNSVVLCI